MPLAPLETGEYGARGLRQPAQRHRLAPNSGTPDAGEDVNAITPWRRRLMTPVLGVLWPVAANLRAMLDVHGTTAELARTGAAGFRSRTAAGGPMTCSGRAW